MKTLKILLGIFIAIGLATLFCYGIYQIALQIDRSVKLIEEIECIKWEEQKEELDFFNMIPDLWFATDWQIEMCDIFDVDLR